MVGRRLTETGSLEVDQTLVARLLLGALSEHEQRLLAVRLIECDDEFRAAMHRRLRPFEMFDVDAVQEYDEVLRAGRDVETRRKAILRRTAELGVDLEGLVRDFTFPEALELGGVTPRLFTWSMAEHLLARSRRPGQNEHLASTSLYLALMVIDVVEMLGSVGHSPRVPAVVKDVRRRIQEATVALARRSSPEPI